jgi:class 3 adenylate cyclase
MTELDVRHLLPMIQVPTLVIQNDYKPDAEARYLADHIPGARFLKAPGHDYLLFGDDFEPVLAEVARFLTGTAPVVEVDRILTTVLFTDIVGSTERASSLGDAAWRAVLDAHDRVVRAELARFRGREVNTTGDGFVAAFDGPARAIRCAHAITRAVAALGIEVRVGLHTGECEVRGDDLAGIAVHTAARVNALANPGEVLVSGVVVELVNGSGLAFEPRGEFELKGIPGRHRILTAVA